MAKEKVTRGLTYFDQFSIDVDKAQTKIWKESCLVGYVSIGVY